MDETYALLMQGAMILLGLCLVVCLFRAFRGPKTADRMDVALIYTLLSFLTVMLLCRIFIGSYRQRHEKEAEQNG